MRSVCFAVTLLAAIGAPAMAQQGWVEVKSPHFTVISNAGERGARDIGWQFEQFRGAIESGWPWARVRLDRPVTILAAKDEGTMKMLLPAYWERPRDQSGLASLLATAPDRHYIAIRTDTRLDNVDNPTMNPYLSAYWSYTLLTLDAAFDRRLPLWFRIGMAEVLSNTVVRNTELRFGLPIPRNIAALNGPRQRLRELLELEASSTYFKDNETRFRFDAQCWALLHYLLFGRPEDSANKVNDLARLLLEGKPSIAAVEEAFGNLETLESAYMRYSQRPVFQYAIMKVDSNPASRALPSRALAAHETAAIHGRFYAATNRPAEARTSIAASRKASPESPGSYEAEALLLDREAKRDEARASYLKATELKSDSAYAHYRLARLIWGTNPDAATLDQIETLLKRSIELNDADAWSYALLAEAMSRKGQGEAAMEPARKAVVLEPGEPGPRLAMARVLWRLSRPDDARGHALAARALADTEEEQKDVQQLLDFLAANARK